MVLVSAGTVLLLCHWLAGGQVAYGIHIAIHCNLCNWNAAERRAALACEVCNCHLLLLRLVLRQLVSIFVNLRVLVGLCFIKIVLAIFFGLFVGK